MARTQVFGEQVQVSLRGRNLRVPEHHREPHNVAAVAQVVGREGVAQSVPAETREAQLLLEQVQRRRAVAFLPASIVKSGKHKLAANALLRLELLQPIQPLTEFWRERHEPLLLALAEHL